MDPKLILISPDKDQLVLPMSTTFHSYSGLEVLHIVYQNDPYHLRFDPGQLRGNIKNISLLVHNLEIDIEVDLSDDVADSYHIICKNNHLFHMIYGITEIAVCLELRDDSEIYLFSGHLAIAIEKQYEKTMESIREMLDDIYQKDHALLYSGKTRNATSFPKYLRNSDRFEEEVGVFKLIYQTLQKNLPYFIGNPKYATVDDLRIDSIEKLKNITSENLQYISMHPEFLKRSYGTGIYVNRQMVTPSKTLVGYSKKSYDIDENRTIIAFIEMLVRYLNKKLSNLKLLLHSEQNSLHLTAPMKENYILSTAVIQHYALITLSNYYKSLRIIFTQLSNIYVQYKMALPCTDILLSYLPKPTPIFLEIYHYRNIYEVMQIWYSFGDFNIPQKNLLLHFSSVDVIYEYYCLLNLYDALIKLGYSEEREKREAYKYHVTDPRYTNTPEHNTYYFTKEESSVVLYYQPVIYSYNSNTSNGISLHRTDKHFFSPDFILKHTNAGGTTTYGILDAKWRTRRTLEQKETVGGLRDTIFKYYYSIVEAQSLLPCSFLWLLQGKDDASSSKYTHNRGDFSTQQANKFRNATGILRLTPQSGISTLVQILRTFLST